MTLSGNALHVQNDRREYCGGDRLLSAWKYRSKGGDSFARITRGLAA
jgi:hypothetical protein